VLLWFIAFFGVIFATNFYFIAVAVKTFSGEDVAKPYLQGIEYNQTLARRAAQRKLNWQAAISVMRLPSGQVRLTVQMARPLTSQGMNTLLTGVLRHPTNENFDRNFILKQVGPDLYRTELADVRPGAWDVIVQTQEKDVPFEATRRLWVP
jgi:nitrogen fixation protein FixH